MRSALTRFDQARCLLVRGRIKRSLDLGGGADNALSTYTWRSLVTRIAEAVAPPITEKWIFNEQSVHRALAGGEPRRSFARHLAVDSNH